MDGKWDALLAESNRLTTHISQNQGVPYLKKTLHEIEASSKNLTGQTTAVGSSDDTATGLRAPADHAEEKAIRLLSQKNFDAERFRRNVSSLHLKASYKPLKPLGETDIAGFLEHHHDMIIVTAVEEAKRSAGAAALLKQRHWEWEEWCRAKEGLMEVMGRYEGVWRPRDATVIHRDNSSQDDATNAFRRSIGSSLSKIGVQRLREEVASSSHHHSFPSSQLTTEMQRYVEVVQSLNMREFHQTINGSPANIAQEFAVVADSLVPQGTQSGPAVMQAHTWKLLSHMLGKCRPQHSTTDSEEPSQYHLVHSALSFLETQFRDMVRQRVSAAVARGQLRSLPGSSPGLRDTVISYVDLLAQANSLNVGNSTNYAGAAANELEFRNSSDSLLWPRVYFCLRCGGIREALELVRAAAQTSRGGLAAVGDMLEQRLTNGNSSVQTDQAERIRASYDGSDTSVSPYEKVVLNILLRFDSQKIAPFMRTVEDYMWFKLSFCADQHTCTSVLENLQRDVKAYGRRHFDQEGRSPLLYVMVLFLSQLFSDGVNYINECGLIVLAVHMGIALSCHGLMPIDKEGGMGVLGVAGSRNRSGSNRNDSDLFLGHGDGRAATVPLDVPSVSVGRLIMLYAQGLQSTDPKAALEYILRLLIFSPGMPGKSDFQSSVLFQVAAERLLLDSHQYSVLAGDIGSDGYRTPSGALDSYLSQDEVRHLLLNAAATAESNGMPADAVCLYGLGSSFMDVLRVINNQLAMVLVPPHPARDEWKALAAEFFEKHLSSGQTYVQAQLMKSSGGEIVGSAFQILLNLGVFFDHWEAGRWRDALMILDGLNIIPTEEKQTMACVNAEGSLPQLVQRVLPELVVKAMDCLYHEYTEVKQRWASAGVSSPVGDNETAAESRVLDIRRRAAVLVTFASLIKNIPVDVGSTLAHMEVMMM